MKPNLSQLPDKPGVYFFLNDSGDIIYIGKAKNLKKRVSSYWFKSDQLTPAKQQMVAEITKIQYTIVDNEWESLLLEATQIKKHQPKYNIVLKDDKNWGYIVVTKEEFPELKIAHGRKKYRGQYFGPYNSTLTARNLVKLLNRILPLKRGSQNLSYQRLGLFTELNDPIEYQKIVKLAIKIIRGDTKSLEQELLKTIKNASRAKNFELAQIKRDQLQALQKLKNRQKIIGSTRLNLDLVNLATFQDQAVVVLMKIRQGVLGDKFIFRLTNKLKLADREILEKILQQYYSQQIDLPKNIVCPIKISSPFNKIKISVPRGGKNKQLLNLLKTNAEDNLHKNTLNPQLETLLQLQKLLQLKNFPARIETYDISNIQGQFAYGSMVVFVDGQIAADQYRLFKIHNDGQPNDVEMMKQVLSRRQKHTEWPKPDLIVLDGGKPQLNTVYPILSKDWKTKVITLAKREEEIFTPKKIKPIQLAKTDKISLLLQNMRNQAHKFGIKNYRQAHRREFKKSTSQVDKPTDKD